MADYFQKIQSLRKSKLSNGWLRCTFLLAVILILASACTASEGQREAEATATLDQEVAAIAPLATIAPPPKAVATSTALPTATATTQSSPTLMATVLPSPTMEQVATSLPDELPDGQTEYQVAFVLPNDTLNVRNEPGPDNEISGELAPGEGAIEVNDAGEQVAGSTWLQVEGSQVSGWVNARFLVEEQSEEQFCQDPEVKALLDSLQTAILNEDDALLASLVHPERGLRLRYSWSNPEILLTSAELNGLFQSDTVYNWGIADGSGHEIMGTFPEIMTPLLLADFDAAETACAEILHGPTAGLVQLPQEYEPVPYFSYFRSAEDELGFDWGSWAVGIERWQGSYFVSYLVHFQYEI